MRSAPCAAQRRGRCGRSTTTTTTTTSTCACGRASRSSLDPASFDHLKVVPQLLGFPQIVPAEELFHARGNLGDHGLRMVRSEEHTSELQSQSNLVCRLLLEKKKKKN